MAHTYCRKLLSHLTSTDFQPGPITTLMNPGGYSTYGDNWTSENAFSDGVGPRRIYVTGLMFNISNDPNNLNKPTNPSAIRTWYSDNGGATWNNGWNVDQRDSGIFMLDKPASDVFWYSGTRDYFYVAYTDLVAPQSVIIRESTSGVQSGRCLSPGHCIPPTFTEAVVTSAHFPTFAQVVVNSSNGHLYVLWASTATSEIRMKRSLDGSVTNLDPTEYIVANGFTLAGTVSNDSANPIKAESIPHARFKPVTNRVMLTWHGLDAGSAGTTDIFYTSFDADALQPGSPVPSRVAIRSNGDQFQPNLDNDNFGNALVTYFSNEFNHEQYQLFGAYISTSNVISPGPTPLSSATPNLPFIGDYRDTFYWTGLDSDGTR